MKNRLKYIQNDDFRPKLTYQKALLTIFVVYIHAFNLDIYPLKRQNGGQRHSLFYLKHW